MGELPQSSALLHVRLQRQSEQLVPSSQVGADVHGILLWPLGGLAFVGERCSSHVFSDTVAGSGSRYSGRQWQQISFPPCAHLC